MAEPRTRVRQKGQYFNTQDLSDLLYAFGAPNPPHLQSTITALDEIITDFVIEVCHGAALSASYSRRQKIKYTDFQWVVRKNEEMLGRAVQSFHQQKDIQTKRKAVDVEKLGEGAGLDFKALADEGDDKKGKHKGRRGKRKADSELGGPAKKTHI